MVTSISGEDWRGADSVSIRCVLLNTAKLKLHTFTSTELIINVSCGRRALFQRCLRIRPCKTIFRTHSMGAVQAIAAVSDHWHFESLRVSWWRHQMETFSALLALYAENSPVSGKFSSQRPVTRCFDLHLNKRLNKQTRCWWLFETESCSLWRVASYFETHFDRNSICQMFTDMLNKESVYWILFLFFLFILFMHSLTNTLQWRHISPEAWLITHNSSVY